MTTPIRTQIAMAMCSVDLRIPGAETNGASERLPGLRAKKKHQGQNELRLHVIMRSRFIFR